MALGAPASERLGPVQRERFGKMVGAAAMTIPMKSTDRDLLEKWLLGQIRQVLANARDRHVGVLPGSDAEILSEIQRLAAHG